VDLPPRPRARDVGRRLDRDGEPPRQRGGGGGRTRLPAHAVRAARGARRGARARQGRGWVKRDRQRRGLAQGAHLFGIALALEVRERTGSPIPPSARRASWRSPRAATRRSPRRDRARRGPPAARVHPGRRAPPRGRAAGRPRRAHRGVPARPGETGDPCVHAFRAARDRGAIPFCVQGNENGSRSGRPDARVDWPSRSRPPAPRPTAVRAGRRRRARERLRRGPRARGGARAAARDARLHAVRRPARCRLRRAWERVAARALQGSEERARILPSRIAPPRRARDGTSAATDRDTAEVLLDPERADDVRAALRHARGHRSRYMWPWEHTPHQHRHGILDDETGTGRR